MLSLGDNLNNVVTGDTALELELTYVLRETEGDGDASQYGHYVKILTESSSQLHSIPQEQYAADFNASKAGPSFTINLKEAPYWLSEREKRILGGTEAIVFLMLALLAVNHAIHLLTELILILYSWTKSCRRKLKHQEPLEMRDYAKGNIQHHGDHGHAHLTDDHSDEYRLIAPLDDDPDNETSGEQPSLRQRKGDDSDSSRFGSTLGL